jgi:hypothetical protein
LRAALWSGGSRHPAAAAPSRSDPRPSSEAFLGGGQSHRPKIFIAVDFKNHIAIWPIFYLKFDLYFSSRYSRFSPAIFFCFNLLSYPYFSKTDHSLTLLKTKE